MDDAVLDAHVALRLTSLEGHDAFIPSDAADASVRAYLAAVHQHGTVHVLEHGAEVLGVLAWRAEDDPWCGEPVTTVALDYASAEQHAERVEHWLDGLLATELPKMEADLHLALDRGYSTAYRVLRKHGLGIDSIVLLGTPTLALERLKQSQKAPLEFPSELRIAPMTAAHVSDMLALQRDVFTVTPQFCFFGANEPYLETRHEQLISEIATDETHFQSVLLRDEQVVGHVCASVNQDNAFWGPCAGMGLLLDPSLRGRGLLRPIYTYLLEGMIERGARTFKGGTNQPPVLHFARVMGRPLHTLLMRRSWFFDEAHFGAFVPR